MPNTEVKTKRNALLEADVDRVPLEQAISLVYALSEAVEHGGSAASDYADAIKGAHIALCSAYENLSKDIDNAIEEAGFH